MGMFDKYDKLNPNLVPDNTSPTPSVEFDTIDTILPRPMYNFKNEFIGYSWNYGEHFTFTLTTGDMIQILKDSIVYNKSGEYPTNNTIPTRVGQQAYNTVDAKSWTYVENVGGNYLWARDPEVTYPIDGDKSIIIHSDMTDSYPQLNIYDFRGTPLIEVKGKVGDADVSLNIDEETDKILGQGVYSVTLKIIGENECRVKNKFTIVIN